MHITESEVINLFGGIDSYKILSAKTISKKLKTTKRKCHAFLYRTKKIHKLKDIQLVGTGTRRASLWSIFDYNYNNKIKNRMKLIN